MDARLAGGRRLAPDIREAIQQSHEPTAALCRRYGLNPKTVRRWRERDTPQSRKPGPRQLRSTVLSEEAEALILLLRVLTRLALDDCLYAMRVVSPDLSRASLYRCFRRRQLGALAEVAHRPAPAGWLQVHRLEIDAAEQRASLFVAVDPHSRLLAFQLVAASGQGAEADALAALARRLAGVRGLCADRQGFSARDRLVLQGACAAAGVRLRWIRDAPDRETLARVFQIAGKALEPGLERDGAAALQQRLDSFLSHYNNACRLKALGGRTPAACFGAPPRQAVSPPPGRRAPEAKRRAMLHAARAVIAKAGPEGLSMSEVARLAGVNRGTAYQHFKSRAELIAATANWSSEQLKSAVFGQAAIGERADVATVIRGLSDFAIQNPEICRAWLFQVLTSRNPAKDVFWREYHGRAARFHDTVMAAKAIDAEVLSVIILAGTFLWPMWARGKCKDEADLPAYAERFSREFLRLAMYGTLQAEHFPDIASDLQGPSGDCNGAPREVSEGGWPGRGRS